VPVIMRTHEAPERSLKRAFAEIQRKKNRAIGARVYPYRGESLADELRLERLAAAQRLFNWPGLNRTLPRFLPVTDATPVVTLNEGNTPLIEAPSIAERLGLNIKVYFKFEGANPTGSFKDRGMTVAISKALGEGARAVICASTGNTAAYGKRRMAGRAGLQGVRADSEGRGGGRQAVAKRDARCASARGDRQFRHLPESRARISPSATRSRFGW